ncbi:MAG TPA: penicillin acylase family protein, partial [Actinomycetota bacterium]|nr:penicillin acylase family protein [Actinomycetota bacterium]
MLAAMLPARASAAQITIVRDRFGVPHVYGATAADVSYGAGYALAQDRLWQMHVFRMVAKGRLSHLLGSLYASNDKVIRFWTYTAAERAERFATYPADIRENLTAFVAGANAYIAEVRADPARKLPLEFAQFGEPLDDWTLDDSLAMADYLIYTFGSGGGSEVNNLSILQQLKAKFGDEAGAAAFDDIVWTNDPDAPASIPEGFDWHANDSRARPEADAKTLHEDARLGMIEIDKVAGSAAGVSGLTQDAIARIPVSPHVLRDIEALTALDDPFSELFIKFGSNAQIAGPDVTDTGNTMGTAGPQVGLFVPQALTDFGLHSADGKLDATGMTFAGAGPAVLIGRGRGYHWTTTTGASDITDTFVEKLHPENQRLYLFNPDPSDPSQARWENMKCRTEVYAIKGVQFDTQEICRTRHGPVLSWDVANGVAYAARYAWFNREGGTIEGFFRYNEARSIEDFATFSNLLASNHNMFYTDDQGSIGYWHPGNFPVRAPGDLRLPFSGTGEQEWRGLLKAQQTPHAVYVHGDGDPNDFSRQWLANWNNKPAVDWDRENGWGAFDRTKSLIEALDPATPVADPWGGTINGDGKISWQDLNANLRYGAYRDFNADFIQRFLPAAGANANEQRALDACKGYNGAIYDDNGDGFVDSNCYTILN